MYGFQCSHSSRTVSALEFIRGGASKNIVPSSWPGAYVVQRGAVLEASAGDLETWGRGRWKGSRANTARRGVPGVHGKHPPSKVLTRGSVAGRSAACLGLVAGKCAPKNVSHFVIRFRM